MKRFPASLSAKLQSRIEVNALRQLPGSKNGVDFSSNDYLGFSRSETLFQNTQSLLSAQQNHCNGATGSRLLSGNFSLYMETEAMIAAFHRSSAALIFNSGYDANLGFFSAVPQRNDVVLYDELSHASIRDGIRLSNARSYKFLHNDLEDLERQINRFRKEETVIYIVTETVFSMDGDCPDLEQMALLSDRYGCFLVVDEAHALGVFGDKGEGLVQALQLEPLIFARIMTYGKGLGCHGAAILGDQRLRDYLVNFARSFIYTTGLSPHAVATIQAAYKMLEEERDSGIKLKENIIHFNQVKNLLGLKPLFIRSKSAIQSAVIPGNEKVKYIADQLGQSGFDVRPIMAPTVPEGQERLRFCLHSYNSKEEIAAVLRILNQLL
ncbi:aminotransferase class I/II-fold pyridoxal phosphate-dependent enzyme [Flavobacterium cerinum]|uniref:8-amino-7-oxononanoate synthase n=1 Tax=Flavobacterium cerinum TaxID=2502784 RepID=A0ABY5IUH6_9FLAO|nr:8-amino-7-oxononanoate synthase [Flavobacterium cerinum]UUC46470.1 8-amino-7-oxononanoate synthase [Flavobacterium cerinum]